MTTTNTPLTHMLLKTQLALMRDLKGSFKFLYVTHFPLVFYNKQLLKGNKLLRKVTVK